MEVKAAVAHQPNAPLAIERVHVDGPRSGEVLVEIKATGVCHTDALALPGTNPSTVFPAILGHDGAGIVAETGAGVMSVKPGDRVIPLYVPDCRQCGNCVSGRPHICWVARENVVSGQIVSIRVTLGGR